MPHPWTKALIVGGPGSGKTTLARRLADRIGCALYELDVIGYEGAAGPERSPELRQRDIDAIMTDDAWVAEGSYTGWIDPLATGADVIIWLDVPWRTARYRLISRHARTSLRWRNKHPGLRKLWRFVQYAKSYYTGADPGAGRLQTAEWLDGFTTPIVICRTNSELESLIESGRFDTIQHSFWGTATHVVERGDAP